MESQNIHWLPADKEIIYYCYLHDTVLTLKTHYILMRPKPLKVTNNHHLKIWFNLRKHHRCHKIRIFQIFLLCPVVEDIKPSRNQNNTYRPELCSCFYNRVSASDYTVWLKDTGKRKNKIFKQEEGRPVGDSGTP